MDKSCGLSAPELREELRLYLVELQTDDPRTLWEEERRKGLCSGIDEVFHFFFDDHEFDENAIGEVFFGSAEAEAVVAVKSALDAVLEAVGDLGDDEFVQHALWRNVTHAARAAQAQLSASS